MAQAGFTPISLYFSTTAAAVPTSGNLANGELALNTTDEKLYFKNAAGTVKLLASNAGSAGSVTSVAATVPSVLSISGSPITASGTLAITYSGTALPVANGGTGQTTASAAFNALSPITTTGDLIVGNGTNSATRLGIGTNGYVLTSNGSTATWSASTGGVTSFSAGSTGLTPSTTTTGAVTLAGTLAIANGGTGQTTANTAFNALAPSQTSNSGKYLTTDGTNSSWATVVSGNRIINGAMVIDQRNAGASLSVANTGVYSLDRWRISNGVSTITVQQSSSVIPVGFGNSLGLAVSTTDNTSSHAIQQYIEGFNTADLGLGTASASTFTLSFWVRSSLTGLYGVGFQNSAQSRSYVGTYTINSANTWEQKSITVAGDTSGTWIGATNGIGLSLEFDLGSSSSFNQTAGSWGTVSNARRTSSCVNWANTASATFYITGVQLEKGSIATSFDYRPYGTELALCQRYLPAFTAQSGVVGPLPGMGTALGTNCVLIFNHPVPARVPGTGVTVSSNSHFSFSNNDGNSASTAVSFAAGSPNASQISITVAVSRGGTTTPGWFYANNSTAYLYITGCEL